MTRTATTILIFGYLLLVPSCFFSGTAMANTAMSAMSKMSGMEGHTPAFAGCVAGATIGCAHFADPHAASGGHSDMYLSLTETPLQSLVFVLALSIVGFAIALGDLAALVLSRTRYIIRSAHLRAPRASTRRDLFARLALFEASPNPA